MPTVSRSSTLRFAALALAALLGGCAAQTGTLSAPSSPDVSAPPPPSVAGGAQQNEGTCQAGALASAVGETLSDERAQALRADSGARDVRVLAPDSMATMDYREDRLNIEVDEQGRITGLRCG